MKLNEEIQKRQLTLIRISCLFWLFTKLITYRAWLTERSLPTVSFFSYLDSIPAIVHILLYVIALLLLIVCFLKPLRSLLIALLFTEVSSVLLDAIRLQPWEYLYLFILLSLILFYNKPKYLFSVIIVLVSSTYIFSGLHKFSGAFLNNIWDDFILKRVFSIPKNSISVLLHYCGLFLAATEFILGGCLLILKDKRLVIYGLAAMHFFIIIALGLVLKGENYSVIPWNLFMILVLLLVRNQTASNVFKLPIHYKCVYLLFWFVLPFLNIFGFWAHYLSSGMYTGKTPKVCIYTNKNCIKTAAGYGCKKQNISDGLNSETVDVYKWTVSETGVVPFPELWYYKRLCYTLKSCYGTDIEMFYHVYGSRGWHHLE